MFLPSWLVPGFFTIVCVIVVLRAKSLLVKGFGVLFGAIFLWGFVQHFMRDTLALVFIFFIAAGALAFEYWRSRRKAVRR